MWTLSAATMKSEPSKLLHMEFIKRIAHFVTLTLATSNIFMYCRYGIAEIDRICLNYLELNLLDNPHWNSKYLRSIPMSLLIKVVKSPKILIIQTDFAIYNFLKYWLFLQLDLEYDCKCKWDNLSLDSSHFFKARKVRHYFSFQY